MMSGMVDTSALRPVDTLSFEEALKGAGGPTLRDAG